MRARSIILAGAPPLVIIGLWVGAILVPTGNSARELEDRLASSDAELVRLVSTLDESRTVDLQMVELNDELSGLSAAVPPTADVAGLVRLLHDLAQITGTTVSSVTPQASEPSALASQAAVMNTSLSVEGEYSEIMAFVDGLLGSDRLVEIISVDLAADSSAGTIYVDLVIATYFESDAGSSVDDLLIDAELQVSAASAGPTLEADA